MNRLVFDQGPDQAQELHLLRALSAGEKGRDLDMRDVTARSDVRLVADEHASRRRSLIRYQRSPFGLV